MTFEDLPKDWANQPITTELMPDVIDLVVKLSDRHTGCLTLLLLDEDHHLLQPITIEGFDPEPDPLAAEGFLTGMLELTSEVNGSFVVARGRSGPAATTPDDLAWFEPVQAALGNHLLARYVASSRGVVAYEAEAFA